MNEYNHKAWRWGAHADEDCGSDVTPEELNKMLNERVEWVKDHKSAVEKYFRKRNGPTWARAINHSSAGSVT